MARVLLIDCEHKNARELVQDLQKHGHAVSVCKDPSELAKMADLCFEDFDIFVFVLSGDIRVDGPALEYLVSRSVLLQMILCVSFIYLGPRVQLNFERRGVRFLYAA